MAQALVMAFAFIAHIALAKGLGWDMALTSFIVWPAAIWITTKIDA